VELIARAKEQLRTLTGYEIDSVSAFTKSDGGWRLSVTVVELHRIPPVTDVLARYDVDLDTPVPVSTGAAVRGILNGDRECRHCRQ
jgi:hypothetical protein